jgi:hypothetical protein
MGRADCCRAGRRLFGWLGHQPLGTAFQRQPFLSLAGVPDCDGGRSRSWPVYVAHLEAQGNLARDPAYRIAADPAGGHDRHPVVQTTWNSVDRRSVARRTPHRYPDLRRAGRHSGKGTLWILLETGCHFESLVQPLADSDRDESNELGDLRMDVGWDRHRAAVCMADGAACHLAQAERRCLLWPSTCHGHAGLCPTSDPAVLLLAAATTTFCHRSRVVVRHQSLPGERRGMGTGQQRPFSPIVFPLGSVGS